MDRSLRLLLAAKVVSACGRTEPAPETVTVEVPATEAAAAAETDAHPPGAAPSEPAETDTDRATDDGGATDGGQPEADPRRGQVGPGDSLSRILGRAGLDPRAVHAVERAVATVADPGALRPGQDYAVELGDDGRLSTLRIDRSPIERLWVRRGPDDQLRAEIERSPVEVVQTPIEIRIDRSLWEAVTSAGESPALVGALVDAFAWDIDFFTDVRPGDTVRLLIEKRESGGSFVDYGDLLAAVYDGGVGTVRVFRWDPPGKAEPRLVDEAGHGIERTLLKTPLKFSRVSSQFNPRRMHPVLHRVKGHNGVDYAAPVGTPVWAAADGEIVVRGEKGGAGNMVVLSHAAGMRTLYMHLSRFREGQRVGTAVRAKTVIGYVGATGLATGPHLHFAVTIGGRYVDPATLKAHRHPGVGARDRGAFARLRARLSERLAAAGVSPPAASPAAPDRSPP